MGKLSLFYRVGLISLLMLGGLLSAPGLAMNDPEGELTRTIKDYVLTKYPSWDSEGIKVNYKMADKLFEEMKAISGEAQLKILEAYSSFKPVGSVILPVQISSETVNKRVLVRARIEALRRIVVAANQIPKGQAITGADLKIEERDVALLPQKYFVDNSFVLNKEAKISIPANSTIFEWMVGEAPLIHRGDEVNILANNPGITVKVKGEALEDGQIGSEIKVLRKDSKKILQGKIVSPTEVEVKI